MGDAVPQRVDYRDRERSTYDPVLLGAATGMCTAEGGTCDFCAYRDSNPCQVSDGYGADRSLCRLPGFLGGSVSDDELCGMGATTEVTVDTTDPDMGTGGLESAATLTAFRTRDGQLVLTLTTRCGWVLVPSEAAWEPKAASSQQQQAPAPAPAGESRRALQQAGSEVAAPSQVLVEGNASYAGSSLYFAAPAISEDSASERYACYTATLELEGLSSACQALELSLTMRLALRRVVLSPDPDWQNAQSSGGSGSRRSALAALDPVSGRILEETADPLLEGEEELPMGPEPYCDEDGDVFWAEVTLQMRPPQLGRRVKQAVEAAAAEATEQEAAAQRATRQQLFSSGVAASASFAATLDPRADQTVEWLKALQRQFPLVSATPTHHSLAFLLGTLRRDLAPSVAADGGAAAADLAPLLPKGLWLDSCGRQSIALVNTAVVAALADMGVTDANVADVTCFVPPFASVATKELPPCAQSSSVLFNVSIEIDVAPSSSSASSPSSSDPFANSPGDPRALAARLAAAALSAPATCLSDETQMRMASSLTLTLQLPVGPGLEETPFMEVGGALVPVVPGIASPAPAPVPAPGASPSPADGAIALPTPSPSPAAGTSTIATTTVVAVSVAVALAVLVVLISFFAVRSVRRAKVAAQQATAHAAAVSGGGAAAAGGAGGAAGRPPLSKLSMLAALVPEASYASTFIPDDEAAAVRETSVVVHMAPNANDSSRRPAPLLHRSFTAAASPSLPRTAPAGHVSCGGAAASADRQGAMLWGSDGGAPPPFAAAVTAAAVAAAAAEPISPGGISTATSSTYDSVVPSPSGEMPEDAVHDACSADCVAPPPPADPVPAPTAVPVSVPDAAAAASAAATAAAMSGGVMWSNSLYSNTGVGMMGPPAAAAPAVLGGEEEPVTPMKGHVGPFAPPPSPPSPPGAFAAAAAAAPAASPAASAASGDADDESLVSLRCPPPPGRGAAAAAAIAAAAGTAVTLRAVPTEAEAPPPAAEFSFEGLARAASATTETDGDEPMEPPSRPPLPMLPQLSYSPTAPRVAAVTPPPPLPMPPSVPRLRPVVSAGAGSNGAMTAAAASAAASLGHAQSLKFPPPAAAATGAAAPAAAAPKSPAAADGGAVASGAKPTTFSAKYFETMRAAATIARASAPGEDEAAAAAKPIPRPSGPAKETGVRVWTNALYDVSSRASAGGTSDGTSTATASSAPTFTAPTPARGNSEGGLPSAPPPTPPPALVEVDESGDGDDADGTAAAAGVAVAMEAAATAELTSMAGEPAAGVVDAAAAAAAADDTVAVAANDIDGAAGAAAAAGDAADSCLSPSSRRSGLSDEIVAHLTSIVAQHRRSSDQSEASGSGGGSGSAGTSAGGAVAATAAAAAAVAQRTTHAVAKLLGVPLSRRTSSGGGAPPGQATKPSPPSAAKSSRTSLNTRQSPPRPAHPPQAASSGTAAGRRLNQTPSRRQIPAPPPPPSGALVIPVAARGGAAAAGPSSSNLLERSQALRDSLTSAKNALSVVVAKRGNGVSPITSPTDATAAAAASAAAEAPAARSGIPRPNWGRGGAAAAAETQPARLVALALPPPLLPGGYSWSSAGSGFSGAILSGQSQRISIDSTAANTPPYAVTPVKRPPGPGKPSGGGAAE
ncbi:hypothetical protein HYH03_006115 [Edaphochlamys debaryana]|uniref:Uncharacterized protein n=1 Tax=Edaphochlamys debaryana TaxID=47281 RepID=A0A835Y6A0_9CHLO|nr:hypothetical protein HYH03_006115 [Edaphochlamys debaryana]|eukprot:KAG2495877.1 hypothetical protein HYH03_006115 [Edaphochlamys debaryana]